MSRGFPRLKTNRYFILLMVFALLISSLSILINIPSTAPYSPYNLGSNGYSKILSSIPSTINILKDLEKMEQNALILIPLAKSMDTWAYDVIRNLLKHGMIIAILDEEGYSNNLMVHLGIGARIEAIKVLDEISKNRSREYPLVDLKMNNITLSMATYKPSYIVRGVNECNFVAKTSKYAYADIDGNGYYTPGEPMGVYEVVCSWRIDNGWLWLIADLDIIANNILVLGNNIEFLKLLLSLNNVQKISLVIDYLNLTLVDSIRYRVNSIIFEGHAPHGILTALLSYFTAIALVSVVKLAERR